MGMGYFSVEGEVLLDDYVAQGLCPNCYNAIEYRLSDECPDCTTNEDEDDEFPNDDEIEIWGKYEQG